MRALPTRFWVVFLLIATPLFFVLNFLITLIGHSITDSLEQAAFNSLGWAVVMVLLLVFVRRRS